MKEAGQIVLVSFPYSDLSNAKLRPVLLIRPASIRFNDWLVCMVSSQIHQADSHLDEILLSSDAEFAATGLKVPSVLRLSRLAVLDDSLLIGCLGSISKDRLWRIRQRLAAWLMADN
ncbi:type II toxin-antitoxin system PemK/MazF family toxin [Rhodoferax sp. 4810]|uniref:Type II toxin-antitoxin system PemK/MazF family toxin n=1 Tax=Thiospirillum jenense TaxID=1653858 RepID=A0A839HBQ5_9GAMM|nr:type II toxin-antitoxin system PemK/MazF family toxin [Thiospirillum jenense]MBB1073182.1 type II toxin-antitoxin system PemK/MazF family toxin [Rhodoferax jenense]MBB1124657.1 type II toxin-antitoxin system PemK/MazF family toxin [Thiospirillum jenense]